MVDGCSRCAAPMFEPSRSDRRRAFHISAGYLTRRAGCGPRSMPELGYAPLDSASRPAATSPFCEAPSRIADARCSSRTAAPGLPKSPYRAREPRARREAEGIRSRMPAGSGALAPRMGPCAEARSPGTASRVEPHLSRLLRLTAGRRANTSRRSISHSQLAPMLPISPPLTCRRAHPYSEASAGAPHASEAVQTADEHAPVQILGVLEAAGATFDHLWVAGLEDRAWPAPPRPNPFLPLPLQQRLRLPHSSAERELHYARRVLKRLLESAPDVVASYPRRDEDTDLRPSPLIMMLEEAEPPAARVSIACS